MRRGHLYLLEAVMGLGAASLIGLIDLVGESRAASARGPGTDINIVGESPAATTQGTTRYRGSGSPSRDRFAILGKWKERGGTEIMEFLRDNTFTVTDKDMTMSGTYTFVGANQMEINVAGIQRTVSVSFSGGTVTLTGPDDKPSTYIRY